MRRRRLRETVEVREIGADLAIADIKGAGGGLIDPLAAGRDGAAPGTPGEGHDLAAALGLGEGGLDVVGAVERAELVLVGEEDVGHVSDQGAELVGRHGGLFLDLFGLRGTTR